MKKFLNILFMFFEVIALAWTMGGLGWSSFEYYTVLSNLFALIVSIIYFYYSYQKKIPKVLTILRMASVQSLLITFIVVVLILLPTSNFDFKFMFGGMNLFLHLICPLLLFFIYMIYDKKEKLTFKELIFTNLLTYIYGLVILPLNILKVVEGPYPFLMVYKQSVFMSFIWFILIVVCTSFIGHGLYKIKKK